MTIEVFSRCTSCGEEFPYIVTARDTVICSNCNEEGCPQCGKDLFKECPECHSLYCNQCIGDDICILCKMDEEDELEEEK